MNYSTPLLSCDLLSTLFLLSLTYNLILPLRVIISVVICFQLCSYYLWLTTKTHNMNTKILLWFAFNFVLTIFDLQQNYILNNTLYVVICFQLCSYYLWLTTLCLNNISIPLLWFAFNFVLTIFDLQQLTRKIQDACGCDLLSTLFLLSLTYNLGAIGYLAGRVVICFQLCSYYLWLTTIPLSINVRLLLWFAFNFVLTIFDLQQLNDEEFDIAGCDLLSTLFLLSLTYNFNPFRRWRCVVVICFQLCSYYLWLTTINKFDNLPI